MTIQVHVRLAKHVSFETLFNKAFPCGRRKLEERTEHTAILQPHCHGIVAL